MNIPVEKNRHWISNLHKSIAGLDEWQQADLLKPCGQDCAVELLALCEKILARSVATIEDLVRRRRYATTRFPRPAWLQAISTTVRPVTRWLCVCRNPSGTLKIDLAVR